MEPETKAKQILGIQETNAKETKETKDKGQKRQETKETKAKQILSILGIALAIGLVIVNIDSIFGLLTTVFPVANIGVVASANIGVYWESQCVNSVSSINWTTLHPGESKSVTLYLKNTGNVQLTLNLTKENWVPESAATYITLAWNYTEGQKIQPSQVLSVTFTLTVSQNITAISSFSFDIRITGTEAT